MKAISSICRNVIPSSTLGLNSSCWALINQMLRITNEIKPRFFKMVKYFKNRLSLESKNAQEQAKLLWVLPHHLQLLLIIFATEGLKPYGCCRACRAPGAWFWPSSLGKLSIHRDWIFFITSETRESIGSISATKLQHFTVYHPAFYCASPTCRHLYKLKYHKHSSHWWCFSLA